MHALSFLDIATSTSRQHLHTRQHQKELGWQQAAQRQEQEYSQLLQTSISNAGGHEHSSGMLCDRCLQPIDEGTFHANLKRLRADTATATTAHRAAAEQCRATQVPPPSSMYPYAPTCWTYPACEMKLPELPLAAGHCRLCVIAWGMLN